MFTEIKYFRNDFSRWNVHSFEDFFYVLFEAGLWAAFLYRIRRTLRAINIPVVNILVKIVNFILFKFTEAFLGVTIRAQTEIGPGLYIGHTGIVRIHPKVRAGRNLCIGQGVTIGQRGPGYNDDAPVLGNNVFIGTGAKVLGAIIIGNNVKIGANAVVLKDVPDNATVVGVPARVVKIAKDKENKSNP